MPTSERPDHDTMQATAGAVACLLAVAAVALGCGGSESGVGLGAFPSKYSQALCAQNFRCCSAADIGGNTMMDCTDTNTSTLEFFASTIADSQSRGRVKYDADLMQMCVDAIAAMSCEDWALGFSITRQPAVCDAAVAPKVAPGGACRDDIDCTTHTCEGADLSADVEGTCAGTSSLGKACTGSADCSIGFYCDVSTSLCAAEKGAGEPCELELECATSCNSTTHQCSCYAGCAVAGPASPGLIGLAAVAALILLVGRRRRSA